jgi:CubicO group peptidase (beta-lactamase class C family)
VTGAEGLLTTLGRAIRTTSLAIGCMFLALGFAAVGPARAAPQVTPALTASIDQFVEEQMGALHIPGLALALVVDGKVAYARGYGVADGSGRPVTPDTPFVIGSTSKQFTGIAVEQLVRSGKLELDAPVTRYLPWFGSGSDPHAQVTIRELLSHTSGMDSPGGLGKLEDWDPGDTLEANARRLADEPLAGPPGGTFVYDDQNYNLLGYLVEAVSGQPYAAYMQQHVFAPLGLHSTFASKTDAEAAGLATGFYPWFGVVALPTPMPYPRSSVPSAGLISSASDLATVVLAQLGHVPAGQSDVDSDLLAATRTPLATVDEYVQYAAGWNVHRFWADNALGQDDPALPLVYEHPGQVNTFRSYMGFVPDRGFGLVLAMNANDVFQPPQWEAVSAGVTRLALGRAPLPAPTLEDPLTQYAKALYVLALLVQLLASAWALRARRRRRLAVAVAAGVNLVVVGLALVYAPAKAGLPLLVLMRTHPDMGLATLIILGVAIAWLALQAHQSYARRRGAGGQPSMA